MSSAHAAPRPELPPGRTAATTGVAPGPTNGNAGGRSGFRGDVEGLRAVAVSAVLLYHAGLPFLTGGYVGVDVFLVISGYLITGLLVREATATGGISLVGFYARRAKRLLPQAAGVLVTVSALSWLLLPPLRRMHVAGDVAAAALYVVNWRFAQQTVDYFDAGVQDSPLQHFWSLAVEEQYYLVWPLVLLAVWWWMRRRGRDGLTVLRPTVATIGVVSLVYCLYATYLGTADAYFSTLTRAWELALGGLLALGVALPVWVPRRVATVLAWAGIGAIVWSAVHFSGATAFPGAAALVPTLGAAAVILAGSRGDDSTARPLTWRSTRYVGRISYAWYVWHWPLLAFAALRWGTLSAWQGLLIAAASLVPAVLTFHFLEEPLRHSRALARRPRRALLVGAVCMVLALVAGVGVYVGAPRVPTAKKADVSGAETSHQAAKKPQKKAQAIRPDPARADEDRSQMYGDGCLVRQPDTSSPPCVYGDPSSDTTVVMFGDSHMMQWFPALNAVAKKRGWRLVGLTKSGCPPADITAYNSSFKRAYTECDDWRSATLRRIEQDEHPALIVTSQLSRYAVYQDGDKLSRSDSAGPLEDAYVSTLRRLRSTGARVVVVRDSPKPPNDVNDCVADSLHHLDRCATSSARDHPFTAVDARAADKVPGVRLLDPTPVICPDGTCPAVMGNALVYRNGGHLTATFAHTLAPWFARRLPHSLHPAEG